MKIKMLTSIAGMDFVLNRGDVTENYSKVEAERLIQAGLAEVFTDNEPDELATLRDRNAALEGQQGELEALRMENTALRRNKNELDALRKRVVALEAERAAAALVQQTSGITGGTGDATGTQGTGV
ncbi:hypothetical protein [Agrobacterium vitis]|uniref:hypothetical protein n=1 Tax=Agrobacterium vitis TaxID=373 RepID=UPI0012E7C83C|nr:hypothetical protein [Agrobacterium vitis]MUZ65328.1 hypothetical protein [Agrobacterium vitis]